MATRNLQPVASVHSVVVDATSAVAPVARLSLLPLAGTRMARRITLAIDIGHQLIRAVQVRPGRPGRPARAVATIFERLPAGLSEDDAEGVGRCLAKAMETAGMS